jgi:hypothetical protein
MTPAFLVFHQPVESLAPAFGMRSAGTRPVWHLPEGEFEF